MIRRITRILLLLQLAIAAGIAAGLHQSLRWPAGVAAVAAAGVVVLIRLLIVANNFRVAWRFRSVAPPNHRLTAWQAARLFFGEFHASMLTSSVLMPFHAFDARQAHGATGMPVLLVHGYGCNSGYWHGMSHALLKAGISHRAIDLEPVLSGIDDYVCAIDEAIDRLCAETGAPRIIIVAHSMGGLAVRAYLRAHGGARVARVITLGTPHQGTALAHAGVGVNCEQMRWTADGKDGVSSDWLRSLAAAESAEIRARFVSLYSYHDNIVSPQTSSHLPGAKNIALSGIGHVALALSPIVQARVIDEIRATDAAAAADADARYSQPDFRNR